MSTLKTPPYRCTGVYRLTSPWEAKPTHLYTCIAIRKFDELAARGIDVYGAFYLGKNIPHSTYLSDKLAGASIITLWSDKGDTIDVPDTFIAAFPQTNLADFKHVVLSCSLGALPTDTPLDNLKSKMAKVVGDALGRTPSVNVHIAPTTNPLTVKEGEQAEKVRQAAIKDRETEYQSVAMFDKRFGDLLTAYNNLKKAMAQKQDELDKLKSSGRADVDKQIHELEIRVQSATTDTIRTRTELTAEMEALKSAHALELRKAEYRAKARERVLLETLDTAHRMLRAQVLPEDLKSTSEDLRLATLAKLERPEPEVGSPQWKEELQRKLNEQTRIAEEKALANNEASETTEQTSP